MVRKTRKNRDWRHRDPQFATESKSYADPVPSRQLVMEDLAAVGKPMTRRELVAFYALSDSAIEAFDHRLRAMLRDGQLLENRRGALGPIDKMDLVRGTVEGHRDGFGFLLPDDVQGDDVFLSPRQMRQVMHGDRVVVHVVGRDSRGRREGRIAEVLERESR